MPMVIRPEGQLDVPVILCDHCGKEIADAREGNYQWKMLPDGRSADRQLFFTHKRCCHAFEQANRGDFHWAAMELQCLPIYLGNNLKLDWESAKKKADMLASL